VSNGPYSVLLVYRSGQPKKLLYPRSEANTFNVYFKDGHAFLCSTNGVHMSVLQVTYGAHPERRTADWYEFSFPAEDQNALRALLKSKNIAVSEENMRDQ